MLNILKNRRSIRKFTTAQVELHKVENIIKAGLWAPSSKSKDPWQFVVVDTPELIESLSNCKPFGAGFLKGAPLAIVVCADETQSDVWVEDASIAATLMQLQAEQEGLGSCWIQIRERMREQTQSAEEYVQQLLEIPAQFRVLSIIAIGYAQKEKPGHAEDQLKFEKVHSNNFSDPFKE